MKGLPETCDRVNRLLLAHRNAAGFWEGELSSSALSTATAICALAIATRQRPDEKGRLFPLVERGIEWLFSSSNPDGGWGDTVRSHSNLSTTVLVWAAFGAAPGASDRYSTTIQKAEDWITARVGTLEPAALSAAIADRYGKDRTFSIPILTMCALSGRLGESPWSLVKQLPFELAAFPRSWFGKLRLPVVSYALPALIAIGQARDHFRPTSNPLASICRSLARKKTLEVLAEIQPSSGGFLEATPLTSFVTMSLAAMGLMEHPVTRLGIDFLVRSARDDGSWAIDTNLSTWLTTLSVSALGESSALPKADASPIREWLLKQQYSAIHPYTQAASGGWAWTNLPGGVPDADDTAGALLALRHLGAIDETTKHAAESGLCWLLDLQNKDGGIPTFCRGWGTLPFDRSGPDLTAHALRAWVEWSEEFPHLKMRIRSGLKRGLAFLARTQREDGAWLPLWFGNQDAPDESNAVYGTSRVLLALSALKAKEIQVENRLLLDGRKWLLSAQHGDGGWRGFSGGISSIEETGLALEALGGCAAECGQPIERAVQWMAAQLEQGKWESPAPIGFYFAKLWYFDRLYPLIFAASGLGSVRRGLTVC